MRIADRLLAGGLTIVFFIILHLLQPPAGAPRPAQPVEPGLPTVTLQAAEDQSGVLGAHCWSGACRSPATPPRPEHPVALRSRTLTARASGPSPTAGALRILFEPAEVPLRISDGRLEATLPNDAHGKVRFLLSLVWPQGRADYGFWVIAP